jgi:Holliday junction resolvase
LGNVRRSRGYSFEHTLVQRLNSGDWNARRLGGSSTGLPDIIAVNNIDATLLSIEAKSGTGNILYVPQDQIKRSLIIRNMFSFYKTRHFILAFKFMTKKRFKRKGAVVYEHRKLIEYYKVADIFEDMQDIPIVKCTYDGKTFAIQHKKSVKINLPDYIMPFQRISSKALHTEPVHSSSLSSSTKSVRIKKHI